VDARRLPALSRTYPWSICDSAHKEEDEDVGEAEQMIKLTVYRPPSLLTPRFGSSDVSSGNTSALQIRVQRGLRRYTQQRRDAMRIFTSNTHLIDSRLLTSRRALRQDAGVRACPSRAREGARGSTRLRPARLAAIKRALSTRGTQTSRDTQIALCRCCAGSVYMRRYMTGRAGDRRARGGRDGRYYRVALVVQSLVPT
jgi:hypothetical protein